MNRPTYVLPLTGKEFESKLSLIDGDSKQVIINAEKISALSATESSDDELTLVTKGYVDDKIGAGNTGVPENLPQSDWNQNDETAPDYVKNRTHYKYEGKDIIIAENVLLTAVGSCQFESTSHPVDDALLYEGAQVVLTFADNTYENTLVYYSETNEYTCTAGVWIGEADVSYVLTLASNYIRFECEYSGFYGETELPISIKIKSNETVYVPLDEKFIPDTIARTLELDALEETLTQRINESGIDAPISSGTGKNSLIIGEGVASGDAAIAGGSTDKQMLESIVGGTVAALVSAKAAEASGSMSLALGTNNKAITAGAGTLGFGNQGGVKGYYWDTIDFSTNTIKLSHNRRTSSYGSMNYVTDFDWAEGDIISMVNDNNYFARSVITSVNKANSTITVDSLPFDEIKYSTGLFDSLTLKPHDRTIYAVYQNDSDTIKTGKPRWVSRSGSVELGFGNFTLGVMNLNTGNASFTSGYNNWAGGAFGASIGRDNRSGYAAFAGGVETKADAYACIAHGLGLLNTSSSAAVFGQYNSLEDIENQLLVIGCGSSNSDRKNALTVSRTGDVKAKGNIYSNNEKVLTAKDLVNKADNERFDSLENPASYLFEQDFSVVPDNWDNGKEAANNYITNSTFRDFTGICGSSVNGALRGGSGIKTIEFTTFLDRTCFHIYATSKCRYKFFNTLTNKERLSQADLGRKVRITAKYFTAQGNSSIGLMSAKSDLYGQKYYKSFAYQNAGDTENWADLDVIVTIDQIIIDEGAALLTFDIGANSELYFTDIRCVELSSIEEIVEDIADITPDWNQNDETAPDYVKNRTHYEEPAINKEYVILDKSYRFEEAQLEGYGGIGDFKYPLVKDWSEIITVGSKLTVTIDGETYEAIFEAYHYGFELPGLLAGTGYDDPYNYPTLYFDADGITLHFGYNAGGVSMDIGPLTISTSKEAIVHQLDEKYIPDTIARTQTIDEKITQSFTSHEPAELIRTSNNSDHSNCVVTSKGQSSDKILYYLRSSNYPEYFPFWDNHNVGSTFLLEIIKDSNIIFSEKLIWHKELSHEHTDESVLGNFALVPTYTDLGDTGELAAVYIDDAQSLIYLYLDEGLLEIDDEVTVKLYYCNEILNKIDDITVNNIQLNNILSNIDSHEYGDYIIAFDPSCTGKGKRYQVCSCCGNKRIEYIPFQGHREAQANEIPVSQLDYGYTSGVYCDRCGITLSGREPIENAGLYESETNNRILTLDELVSTNPEDEGTELLTYIDGYFGSGALSYGNPSGITGDVVIPEGCIYLYKKGYESGGLGFYPTITGVVIPSTCIDLGNVTFHGDSNLSRITYKGTIAQWNNISKGEDWYPTDEEYKPVKCTVSCSDGNLPVDVLFSREPGLYQTGTTTRLKTIDEMLSEDSALTYSNGYFGSWRLSYGLEPYTGFVGDLVLPKDTTHLYNADFGQGGLATYAYITSIVIPNTCKDIGSNTFHSTSISKIIYEGTIAQWNSIITPESFAYMDTEEIKVYCLDGILTIKPTEEV
jgi:hypothetical protein